MIVQQYLLYLLITKQQIMNLPFWLKYGTLFIIVYRTTTEKKMQHIRCRLVQGNFKMAIFLLQNVGLTYMQQNAVKKCKRFKVDEMLRELFQASYKQKL